MLTKASGKYLFNIYTVPSKEKVEYVTAEIISQSTFSFFWSFSAFFTKNIATYNIETPGASPTGGVGGGVTTLALF